MTESPGAGVLNFLTYRLEASVSCSSANLRTVYSLRPLGTRALVLGEGRPGMFVANDDAEEGAGEGRPPTCGGKKPPGPGEFMSLDMVASDDGQASALKD